MNNLNEMYDCSIIELRLFVKLTIEPFLFRGGHKFKLYDFTEIVRGFSAILTDAEVNEMIGGDFTDILNICS